MKYTFHPDARHELIKSVEFYEEQQAKLGLEFLEEIYSTIRRIIEFPAAFPVYSKNTRNVQLTDFLLQLFIKSEKMNFSSQLSHISHENPATGRKDCTGNNYKAFRTT